MSENPNLSRLRVLREKLIERLKNIAALNLQVPPLVQFLEDLDWVIASEEKCTARVV